MKIYRTRPHSIKDLYIILFFTIISMAILVLPINKYVPISTLYNFKIFLSLLIIIVSGYAFWAALIPNKELGISKRLLLTLLFGIVLLTVIIFLLKMNPLNGSNIIIFSILPAFIGLMCMVACLRRIRIPQVENGLKFNGKKEYKSAAIEYDILESKNYQNKDIVEEVNKIDKTKDMDKSDRIPIDQQQNPYQDKNVFNSLDLKLVFVTALICIAFILTPKLNETVIRTVLAILLILFLPGYSLVAALYPKKDDLECYERISLSFGFPLIGVALGIVLTNIISIPINLTYILIILAVFTMLMVFIAYIRRRRFIIDKNYYSSYKDQSTKDIQPNNDPETKSQKIKKDSISEKGLYPSFVSKDLLLIIITTLLTVIFIVIPKLNETFVRTILGLLLILFIPGYSLIAALFPKRGDLDGIERAALSFGLSIAITPLIGLALNYTSYGIRLTPILISLSAFTIIMVSIAYFRRRRVPDDEKFYVNFSGFYNSIKGVFKGESKTSKILSLILILSVILAISTTAYIVIKPKQGETFTEFYILGPGGMASNYPTNLTVGQNASVIIGIVNHEQKTIDYNLIITSNGNIMSDQNITITNGNKTEIPYTFASSTAGNKEIKFLLYKLPDNTNVYRSLHLFVNVI